MPQPYNLPNMMTQPAYISTSDLLNAIQQRQISSLEAVDHFIERIEQLNPSINAVVVFDYERARERARQADAALARGESWGALHGLPMTIKESYEVDGLPTTSGAPAWKDHVSSSNADAVQKLVDAGAIVLGKTNVPIYTGDWQSYNVIYGTTNNPWDETRTPGGSSGGAAAALAAGLTPLELGSDIGGSIRTPAHYCGVYGHKPSYGIVSLRGHMPGPPGTQSDGDLSVAGPMARTAVDLQLALDVLAGPRALEAKAWKLDLPPARANKLTDFRVAYWLDDADCAVDSGMREQLEIMVAALAQAGVQVRNLADDGHRLADFSAVYNSLLGAVMGTGLPPRVFEAMQANAPGFAEQEAQGFLPRGGAAYLGSMVMLHRRWLSLNEKRAKLRQRWEQLFTEFDVLLTPVVPLTAFPHQQEGEFMARTLEINGRSRPYIDHFPWIALATLLGLPATSAPIGLCSEGLPINVQIIGPYLEDKTTLVFAEKLAEVMGGCQVPLGFE
ncbi:MAG: amidase [Chloroflexota bacterium]